MTTTKKLEKIQYSIKDLVYIGDAIHSSFASIIIAANEKTPTKSATITTAVHGHHLEVVDMLYKAMDDNETLLEVVVCALAKLKMERILEEANSEEI